MGRFLGCSIITAEAAGQPKCRGLWNWPVFPWPAPTPEKNAVTGVIQIHVGLTHGKLAPCLYLIELHYSLSKSEYHHINRRSPPSVLDPISEAGLINHSCLERWEGTNTEARRAHQCAHAPTIPFNLLKEELLFPTLMSQMSKPLSVHSVLKSPSWASSCLPFGCDIHCTPVSFLALSPEAHTSHLNRILKQE